MNNKTLHRNIIPTTAIAVAGTLTSQVETATYGTGVRFYITVTGATTGGGIDAIFLCGVVPGTSTILPILGFALVNQLSVNGVYIADFYPSAYVPPAIAVGGALLGAAGIYLPISWAVKIQMGAGNAATIRVDGEMFP
jgi:hypothetical protein